MVKFNSIVENDNKNNIPVVTPSPDYKWNNLEDYIKNFIKLTQITH